MEAVGVKPAFVRCAREQAFAQRHVGDVERADNHTILDGKTGCQTGGRAEEGECGEHEVSVPDALWGEDSRIILGDLPKPL